MNNIIFLDIDGTIRDFDGYIPQSTIEAISSSRKKGNKVFISTGRVHCQIEQRIIDIGFDGVISGSGSYVTYDNRCVHHKCFSTLTSINIINYLLSNGCVLEFQTNKDSYILESQKSQYDEIGRDIQKALGEKALKVTKVPSIITSVTEINNIEKIMFFSDKVSVLDLKSKWDDSIYVVPINIPTSKKYVGEISPITVNKAEGIKSIIKNFNGEYKKIVAIGDSENDIEMLSLADIGVVMGNGTEGAKKVADFVTKPLREDGLMEAFKHFELL